MSQVSTNLQIDFSGWCLQPGAHILFSLLGEEKQIISRTPFCFFVIT